MYSFDLEHVASSHTLEMVGEFGIVFLMFTIGLEISLSKLNTMKENVFFNGSLQVVLSTLGIFLVSHFLLGVDYKTSIIIALAFSLSSTAVVLTHLKTTKEIYTPYGQKATGILIFQATRLSMQKMFIKTFSSWIIRHEKSEVC